MDRIKPSQKNEPNTNSINNNKEENEEKPEMTEEEKEKEKKEKMKKMMGEATVVSYFIEIQKKKCRFFPNCNNKDCPFVHPTEECENFPKCMFGVNCLKIHPEVNNQI